MHFPLRWFVAALSLPLVSRAETLPVSSLDLSTMQQDYQRPAANLSMDKKPLTLGGKTYDNGIGTHANSVLRIDLKKSATRFTATVGVDDEKLNTSASVGFSVKGDDKVLWKSGLIKAGAPPQKIDLELHGVSTLTLRVDDAGDGISSDHADWADAKLEYTGARPEAVAPIVPPVVILTPKPSPKPRINGPAIFGVRPDSPFLYSIPATGTRPMIFSADGLPPGLTLDAATGRIIGVLQKKGDYPLTLRAKNSLGSAEKNFHIIVGDQIALTPPMGWNSWNCWGEQVDQQKVLSSARSLVASGLDQHGWTYINIDDTWQGERGGPLKAIQPNAERFPDMKALCDEIHGMGLKTGIYSTPWTVSYGRRIGGSSNDPEGKKDPSANLNVARNNHTYPFDVGQYHFAKNDAQQWAAWGIDYLKYDWAPVDIANTREMGDALRASGRDIVYSLSNNAPGNIIDIIPNLAPLANAWRTTGDINDTWNSVRGIGFNQDKWAPFQSPGHYNDPDMLVLGHVGWGQPHPTKLTPNEQYTHISLWCLLGAPLLLGSDLDKLDDFTIGLLSNDEVLEIDQDTLCKQGTRVGTDNSLLIYAKPLADGSLAIGLFNLTDEEAPITAAWADLHLTGKQRVRDLWQQKDLGIFPEKYSSLVPSHGVVLLRLFPQK